jgi:hypothetical protein
MRILREPLVHFLLIGAAVFGLYTVVGDAELAQVEERIIVSGGEVDRLRQLWERQWLRPPTAAELQGLIADHVREEVLYREALALGLDRDDTIVRRRLAQKFEFLAEDLATGRDPTKAELAAFFEAKPDRYRIPPRLSFRQIYFNPGRRAAVVQDAELALAGLRSGLPEAAAVAQSDPSLLEEQYREQTPQDIEAIFGLDFTKDIVRLQPDIWIGPIASGYGWHLVRIDERIESRMPALADVADQVRADWAYEQRRQANEAIYQRLLAHYTVIVENSRPDAAALAMPGTDQRQQP